VINVHIAGSPISTRRLADDLTPDDVDAFLRAKRKTDLKARTVNLIRTIIIAAVEEASQRGVVSGNAMKRTRIHEKGASDKRAMTAEQAKALLTAVEGHRLEAYVSLMLKTGCRPGEGLGLRWEDIDFTAGRVSITRTLRRDGTTTDAKARSRRTLALTRELLSLFEARKEHQEAERRAAGEDYWFDTGFVFTTRIGTPLDDRNVKKEFARLCHKAEIGVWTPHEMRHTAATLAILAGNPIETVSKMLGHSSIRVTGDVYGHLRPEDVDTVIESLADTYRRDPSGPKNLQLIVRKNSPTLRFRPPYGIHRVLAD
jgi:integrase